MLAYVSRAVGRSLANQCRASVVCDKSASPARLSDFSNGVYDSCKSNSDDPPIPCKR